MRGERNLGSRLFGVLFGVIWLDILCEIVEGKLEIGTSLSWLISLSSSDFDMRLELSLLSESLRAVAPLIYLIC
mgnify:CR=1 FL=1